MTASGVELGLGGGGIEQKGKRTHGRGQRCGDRGAEGHKGTAGEKHKGERPAQPG